VTIPPPAIAAQSVPTPPPSLAVVTMQPARTHHTALWVGLAIGAAAVVGGSIAIYEASKHSTMSGPPDCVVLP
jgi:hypothetical protein